MLDLLILGGHVIDGTGADRFTADIGISGGLITHLGDLQGMPAARTLHASGSIVAPGFIDAHTHDDRLLLEAAGEFHPKLSQGVTTVVTGNCGVSLAPLIATGLIAPPMDLLGSTHWRFPTFEHYLAELRASRLAVNAVCLVGHTTLRVRHVAELDRPATESECAAMARDVEEALEAGAFGLSTGLYYPPAQAATREEVVAVGRALKQHDGLIAMHIRDEASEITSALEEAFSIGIGLGVRTVLSHHKIVGKSNHGRSAQTLALIDKAARAQDLCLDCYPYIASSTMLMPTRVRDSDEVIVTWSTPFPKAAGRSLFALAREQDVDTVEMCERLQPAGAIYFSMSDEDVSRILAHPMTMIGSDGLAHDAAPHPRLWGTFPRVLGHYSRDRGLFTLEAAIHKMTGMTAQRFGLADRGLVAPGAAADLVVFDEHSVGDQATFSHPTRPALGIEAVVVNGRLASIQGRTVCADAGRVLKRART